MALITTVTFMAASIGTGVAIVASGDPASSFAARSVQATMLPANGGVPTSRPAATVHFTVTNTSTNPVRLRCVAVIGSDRHPSGSATVTTARVPGGSRVWASAVVFLRTGSVAIQSVEVHCSAMPVHG